MLNIEHTIIDNVEFKEETQNIQYLSIHFIDISDDSKSVQSKNERRLFFRLTSQSFSWNRHIACHSESNL